MFSGGIEKDQSHEMGYVSPTENRKNRKIGSFRLRIIVIATV